MVKISRIVFLKTVAFENANRIENLKVPSF